MDQEFKVTKVIFDGNQPRSFIKDGVKLAYNRACFTINGKEESIKSGDANLVGHTGYVAFIPKGTPNPSTGVPSVKDAYSLVKENGLGSAEVQAIIANKNAEFAKTYKFAD